MQRNSHRFWLMTDTFQILTENEENSIINDWNFPIQSMTITLQADLLLAQLVLIVLDKDDFHKRMMMGINLDIKHFKLCISKKKKTTFFSMYLLSFYFSHFLWWSAYRTPCIALHDLFFYCARPYSNFHLAILKMTDLMVIYLTKCRTSQMLPRAIGQ